MELKIQMLILIVIIGAVFGIISWYDDAVAQPDMGFPPMGDRGFGGSGPMFENENLVEKFDADGDGKLNDQERKSARKYIQEQANNRPGRWQSPDRRNSQRTEQVKTIVEAEKTFSYDTKADLYDEKVLRTLYLQFPNEDWFEELADFYRTDIEVPADLIVDGANYPSVGVRFRGNTSYMMASEKKPFNISVDYDNDSQSLYGYRTLNLLNCNEDPSLIREVLYSRICRDYIPAPKANFVKLVINGENFGIYANVQQFNKDFTEEWFGAKGGVRWKIPANMGRGTGALIWNGSEIINYERDFELKTKNAKDAWKDLINLCEVLNKTPDDQLEALLSPILDIDEALWFIALDNVFIDSDGYISRGSDYNLYEDPDGRFHMIPYDNNETFRYGGMGPGSWEDSDLMRSPVAHEKDERRPVISRLLSIPSLRARYLAHIRAIVNEWLDWSVVGPIIEGYQALLDKEVKADDKQMFSYDAFIASATEDNNDGEEFDTSPDDGFGFPPDDRFGPPPDDFMPQDGFFPPPDDFRGGRHGFGGPGPGGRAPSLKSFFEKRREFLLRHPEIDKPVPVIKSVTHESESSVKIKAQIEGNVESVILYYAMDLGKPFGSVKMVDAGNGIYIGEFPPFPAGTTVRYYVEARSAASAGTSAFAPSRAELSTFAYSVEPIHSKSPVQK